MYKRQLLYKADASHTRLILIDPKMLEMSVYEGIPHLLAPVVTDTVSYTHLDVYKRQTGYSFGGGV